MKRSSAAGIIALAIAGIALSGCARQSEGAATRAGSPGGADLAGVKLASSDNALPLAIFNQMPPMDLPAKFGADLKAMGEFDVRLAGILPGGEEFYVGRSKELFCLVFGNGASETEMTGGLACNTPDNVLRLGLYGIRTEIDGTERTVALVPDGCALEPDDKSSVKMLKNVQIMDSPRGIIHCADGNIEIGVPYDSDK